MPAWLLSDWVLWVLTALCGVVGFTLAVRGLIGDRARGRPTCWKCRYDLSHSPTADATVTCPECGHAHKKRKQLFKTRRYWFRFAFGAVLFMIALYCHTGPEVQRRRTKLDEKWWESIVPTTAWIALLPKLEVERIDFVHRRIPPHDADDGTGSTIFISDPDEMQMPHVRELPGLAGWQVALLVDTCDTMLTSPPKGMNPQHRIQLTNWVGAARNRTNGAVPILIRLLDDEDSAVRAIARQSLCTSNMTSDEVTQLFVGRLKPADRSVARYEALQALLSLGTKAATAVPAVIEIAEQSPYFTGAGINELAINVLVAIGEPSLPYLTTVIRDDRHHNHLRTIKSIGRMRGAGRAAWPALLETMSKGQDTSAIAVLNAMKDLEETVVPFLISVACDAQSPHRIEAVKSLAVIGKKAVDAVPKLLPIAIAADTELAVQACEAIDAIGITDVAVKELSRADWLNLLKALRSTSRVLRTFAYGVLVNFQIAALPWVELAINESLIEIDQGLVRLIMQFNEGAKHLSPVLVERMLRDPATFRSEIVDMLVHLGELHPDVFKQIVAALDHMDPLCREIAVNVLAATPMDVKVLLPILGKRMELADAAKRLSAIYLLGRMGPPAAPALPALRKLAAGNDDEIKAAAEVAIFSIEGVKAGE